MLAWLEAEHEKCPGCGLPVSETTGDDADWSAEVVWCRACQAKARKSRPFYRQDGASDGLLVVPVRD